MFYSIYALLHDTCPKSIRTGFNLPRVLDLDKPFSVIGLDHNNCPEV